MTDQAVLLLLRRRAVQAKIAAFTPHDLRRSFISDLLDAGADMVTVQKLAAPANVQTTAKYDRRGEEAKRRAVDRKLRSTLAGLPGAAQRHVCGSSLRIRSIRLTLRGRGDTVGRSWGLFVGAVAAAAVSDKECSVP